MEAIKQTFQRCKAQNRVSGPAIAMFSHARNIIDGR
jgi:hypothetical protein